jgi:hypothetical protein
MILLLWMMGLAQADCSVLSHQSEVVQDGDRWSRTDSWQLEIGTGWPGCRRFHLRTAPGMAITDVAALIRQPDDTKTKLGLERLVAQPAGRTNRTHILQLPELRTRDRLALTVTRSGVAPAPPRRPAAWWADPAGEGASAGAEEQDLVRTQQTLVFGFPEGETPRVGPGSNGWTEHTVQEERRVPAGPLELWLPFPAGATQARCSAALDHGVAMELMQAAEGCNVAATMPAPGILKTEMKWRTRGVAAAGVIRRTGEYSVALMGPGLRMVVQGAGASAVTGGHHFSQESGESLVSWRISRAGDTPVLRDRSDVLSQVAAGALSASMPEPGLGLDFKGTDGDWAVVGAVLTKVRSQVVEGALSGAHPLKPRKLTQVRRSRWGTPWEQALLLTRYLRQLKIDALPVPVRPASAGYIEAAVPIGYTEALVRVRLEGSERWIDPACAVCAVGEIRPGLWGGQALAAGLESVPDMSGTHTWELLGSPDGASRRYTLQMTAPWSTSLRRHLARVPVSGRTGAVLEWAGLTGVLESHQGLSDLGGVVTLRFTVPVEATEQAQRALRARELSP